MDVSETITEYLAGNIIINDIPSEYRERVRHGADVRRDRHEGHSTTQNPDGSVTVVNDRLSVTLPAPEFRSRDHVLTTAMRVLAHRYELTQPQPEIRDDEVEAAALENLTYEYLAENCRYNLSEIIMRMRGGYRMSEGMRADVDAARAEARGELRENPREHLAEAKRQLQYALNLDRRYHEHIGSWCANWHIEIIGPMPEQIGMCRYQEA